MRFYHEGIVVTPSCHTVIPQISILMDMEPVAAWTEAAQVEVEEGGVGGSSLAYPHCSAMDISDEENLLSLPPHLTVPLKVQTAVLASSPSQA